MLRHIKLDFIANRSSGLLTMFTLLCYRVARTCHAARGWRRPIGFVIRVALSPFYAALQTLGGCSLPYAVKIGTSPKFPHGMKGVFISSHAVIGDGVVILQNVTIGSNFGTRKKIAAPQVGNDVLIGANAVVIGNIVIGDGARIGAGSAVYIDIAPGAVALPPLCEVR